MSRFTKMIDRVGRASLIGALLWLAPSAGGQPAAPDHPQRLVAGGDPSADPRATSGHGWVFIPAVQAASQPGVPPGVEKPAVASGHLLHVVPRQSVHRASAGSVRVALPLTQPPLAIAGWEGNAILLQGAPGDDGAAPAERTISTITAARPIAVGTWEYRPTDRLQLRAALPGDTVPRSMVGAGVRGAGGHGPFVVWERVAAGAAEGTLELALLDEGGSWRVLEPPPGLPAQASKGEAHTLATRAGLLVAVRALGEPALTLWHAEPNIPAAGGGPRARAAGPVPVRWRKVGAATIPEAFRSGPMRTIGKAASFWLWRDAGLTVLAARVGGGMTLWRLDAEAAVELHQVPSLPPYGGAMVIGGLDAVTILAYDPPPAPSAQRASAIPDSGRLRTTDVSCLTGAVLADLPAHTDGFFTRVEMAILWALFMVIGVVILSVVVRTDGPADVHLPEGTALASPFRRVCGGLIDVAAAVALTVVLIGGTPAQWLAPTTSASSSLVPLLGVFGIGCLLCTIGEATVGASPGKLIVGARVLGLVPASAAAPGKGAATVWTAARPRLHQALLRNLIRWFMPLMGMLMVFDSSWRHPGDLLARTVVVVRFDPDDEPPPADSDDGDGQ
ncbi:MAG TPA: hypothetical protein VEB22_00970 [Phycisphaerales bacterium]|nr:hypothetical protein [Phycisphaerales bacterium]